MKVRVKAPFFDGTIHKRGEICEVKTFDPVLMEPVVEEKKEKVEKAVAMTPNKTTRKKV